MSLAQGLFVSGHTGVKWPSGVRLDFLVGWSQSGSPEKDNNKNKSNIPWCFILW